MGRKEDLEKNILASYDLVRNYEERIRIVDDPQTKARYKTQHDGQWKLIQGYLHEYIPLCYQLGVSVSQDVVQLAARFRESDATIWSETMWRWNRSYGGERHCSFTRWGVISPALHQVAGESEL